MNLAARIELFLLHKQGWVSAREICEHFGLSSERQLRGKDGSPGILADFAASSTRQGESGYCHHRFLSTAEWLPIKHRILHHSISQLRSIKHQDQARHNILTGKRPDLREVHSGQMLLLPVFNALLDFLTLSVIFPVAVISPVLFMNTTTQTSAHRSAMQ